MRRYRFRQRTRKLRFGIVLFLLLAASAVALASRTTDSESEIRARIEELLATSGSWAAADAEALNSVWAEHKSALEADLSAAVDALHESFFEGTLQQRIAATRLLGKIGGFGATGPLRIRILSDPSPEVKKVALESWVRASAFPQIVDLLRESLAGAEPSTPDTLAGWPSRATTQELLETLDALISEVPAGIEPIPSPPLPRHTVNAALAKRAADRVPAVIEEAIRQSSGPYGAITKAYFSEGQERELRSLGVSAIPPLVEAFSKDRFRRELAGWILVDFGGAAIFESVAPIILNHEDPEVRERLRSLLLGSADFNGLLHVLTRLIREEPATPAGRYAQAVLVACRNPQE